VPLAASAFANSLFTLSFIVGIGVLMSVSVLAARAHGGGQSRECAEYLRHGMILGVTMGVGGALLMFSMGMGLTHFGQPQEVIVAVEPYFQIIAISLVPTLMFQVLRQFSEAVGHPWGAMGILLVSVVLNVVLNWILIYGNLGAPAMGLEGAGWATLIARVVAALALWFWLKYGNNVTREWPGRRENPRWWAPVVMTRLREMLNIGVPAAGQLLFEAGAFASAAIMMGWIGTVPLAAHQIALSCASLTFMVPLGISIATSVRIGRTVGEGRMESLRRIGFGSIATGVAFSVVFTLAFILGGPLIVSCFTHETEVAALAARLLVIAAIFQIFDGFTVHC
jgi:MATE family multidrug resistance protein